MGSKVIYTLRINVQETDITRKKNEHVLLPCPLECREEMGPDT